MREHLIQVFKRDGGMFPFFTVRYNGYTEDAKEVAMELRKRFPAPDFHVDFYKGVEQYYTQVSLEEN